MTDQNQEKNSILNNVTTNKIEEDDEPSLAKISMKSLPTTETSKSPNNGAKAQAFIKSILGRKIQCTLEDGRIAKGKFLCMDRLQNIILADVLERRPIGISHDVDNNHNGIESQLYGEGRQLNQAMIPGKYLVKVQLLE